MILPKDYLSYSAADLWYKNKDGFRWKYYTRQPVAPIASVQMEYGKEIADLLKNDPGHPSLVNVVKYPIRDEGFTVDIDGVPVLMYPDTLDLSGVAKFREYKTSEWSESKPTWTQQKVDDHMQMKLYSLGIKTAYGAVDDLAHLDWLVTRMEDHHDGIVINGKPYGATIQLPVLTGEVITFETVITDLERFRARQWIVQAAHEISADFISYKKNHG